LNRDRFQRSASEPKFPEAAHEKRNKDTDKLSLVTVGMNLLNT
jgi:hypothetical protein